MTREVQGTIRNAVLAPAFELASPDRGPSFFEGQGLVSPRSLCPDGKRAFRRPPPPRPRRSQARVARRSITNPPSPSVQLGSPHASPLNGSPRYRDGLVPASTDRNRVNASFTLPVQTPLTSARKSGDAQYTAAGTEDPRAPDGGGETQCRQQVEGGAC